MPGTDIPVHLVLHRIWYAGQRKLLAGHEDADVHQPVLPAEAAAGMEESHIHIIVRLPVQVVLVIYVRKEN